MRETDAQRLARMIEYEKPLWAKGLRVAGIDEVTVKEIKDLMIKRHDTNMKKNSYWLNILSQWKRRGLDIQTSYNDIVNGLTPAKISNFVKNVFMKSGNNVQVIMLPEE